MGDEQELNEVGREVDDIDAALAGSDDAELGDLAVKHDKLRALESRVEKLKKELSTRIISRMESMGLDRATANGRRLGFTERTNYGVAEGCAQQVKDFIGSIAPGVNIPASTNIAKAVGAYLDQNPGAVIPPFISVTKTRSLTNAKA